ncbi:Uncharacterised protein [uncultured archaeon]|nr:Uncharacterised protein [uncultured archaeon]
MTEEEIPQYIQDLNRYQYADVAGRFGSNEDTAQFVPSTLEKLVSGFGVDKDILEGLKQGTLASEEGIKTAVNIYAGKYKKSLETLKVSEFYEVRFNTLKSLLGEAKAAEAKETFEKYADQSIGSITKKVSQAQAKLKDNTGLFDEAAKAEAKKTLEKLGAIHNLIVLLEDRKFEEIRNDAKKQYYKESITELLTKTA